MIQTFHEVHLILFFLKMSHKKVVHDIELQLLWRSSLFETFFSMLNMWRRIIYDCGVYPKCEKPCNKVHV